MECNSNYFSSKEYIVYRCYKLHVPITDYLGNTILQKMYCSCTIYLYVLDSCTLVWVQKIDLFV